MLIILQDFESVLSVAIARMEKSYVLFILLWL